MSSSFTSLGRLLRTSSAAVFTASPVFTMLASCCLKTLKLTAFWPLMRASESGSFSRSTSWPRSPSVSGRLPLRPTTTWANCFGSRTRPSTRRMESWLASVTRPTGWSLLAWFSAVLICAGVMP